MSDSTQPKPERRRATRKPASRGHRIAVAFGMVVTNLVLVVLVVYAILSLTESSLTAPAWLTERVEAQANAALPGERLSMGRLSLRVNDAGLPALHIANLGVFDDTGAEIARLNQASVRMSPAALIGGGFRPRFLDVSGAQLTMRRRADGQFALSLGGTETTGSLAGLLDQLDAAFAQEFLAEVSELSARDLTIALEDARSGRLWQITDGTLNLRRLDDGLDLSMAFDVFNGTEDLAETEISLRTEAANSAATIGARFRNAASGDIASQSPALSYLSVVDATISGAVRTEIDETGQVSELNGTLEIGGGALQPTAATQPVRFDSARAYFTYRPEANRITFTEVSVESDSLTFRASGHSYLQDYDGAWPQTMLGQFSLDQPRFNPLGQWDNPLNFTSGVVDMRMRLTPFEIEFGQISLATEGENISLTGRIAAEPAGWYASTDVIADAISIERLMEIWPEGSIPQTRDWIAANVTSGQMQQVQFSARQSPDLGQTYELSFGFADSAIRAIQDFPLVRGASGYGIIQNETATLVLEAGKMTAPIGGEVDLAGTRYQIADIRADPALAEIDLVASGQAEAVVSLLALPPINALTGSGFAADFVSGTAQLEAEISYPMKPDRRPDELRYDARGIVLAASSDAIIEGRTIESPRMAVVADNSRIEVTGPFAIGAVKGEALWVMNIDGAADGQSHASGTVALSQAFVDEFDLALPGGTIRGHAVGQFDISLRPGQSAAFTLISDLNRMGFALPQIGWTKQPDVTGSLRVQGTLGDQPGVSALSLTAPGLSLVDGRIVFDENRRFRQTDFGQVQAGAWLSAPVTITNRGVGLAPRISVTGGTMDLRRTDFGASGNAGGGGPLDIALDRVIVSSGITLTEVAAELDASGPLSGNFSARVNGGARLTGRLETVAYGIAVRAQGANGGRILRDAGIFRSAAGGQLDLILTPGTGEVIYRGQMKITDTNVQNAPVLTELLSALSIVGLLDQMRGAGIVFSDVDAEFDLNGDLVRLKSGSAVGPSLGISLDGIYDLNASEINMQGVISPVYFLNTIGQIFSQRQGEGLFGFNYRLRGPIDQTVVEVNPLSILTPGLFRDIFRAPPPEPKQ